MSNYFNPGYFKPNNAFKILNRRALFISDALEYSNLSPRTKHELYLEREALIWVVDKCKDLASRLAFLEQGTASEQVINELRNQLLNKESEIVSLKGRIKKLSYRNNKLKERLGI